MFKEKGILAGLLVFVGILVVSAIIFLSTSDNGGLTGWQTLAQEGAGFWITAIIGTLGAGALCYGFLKSYSGTHDSAGTGATLIAIGLFIAIAFGKGCTDKQNDGVTTAKGRPVKVLPDSNRIPAEDLLPNK